MMNSIGMGPDFPMGFSLLLASDALAKNRFDSLEEDERNGIRDYVNGGEDEADSEYRFNHTLKSLRDGVSGFYRQ